MCACNVSFIFEFTTNVGHPEKKQKQQQQQQQQQQNKTKTKQTKPKTIVMLHCRKTVLSRSDMRTNLVFTTVSRLSVVLFWFCLSVSVFVYVVYINR